MLTGPVHSMTSSLHGQFTPWPYERSFLKVSLKTQRLCTVFRFPWRALDSCPRCSRSDREFPSVQEMTANSLGSGVVWQTHGSHALTCLFLTASLTANKGSNRLACGTDRFLKRDLPRRKARKPTMSLHRDLTSRAELFYKPSRWDADLLLVAQWWHQ